MKPVLAAAAIALSVTAAQTQQIVTPAHQTAMLMGRMVGIAVICRVPKFRLDPLIATLHAAIERQAADEQDRKSAATLFAHRMDEALAEPLPDSTQCEMALSWIKQLEQELGR